MIRSNDISRIILGCGNFGGIGSNPTMQGKGNTDNEAYEILDAAKDLGITQFDTANTYGGGSSESILGQWLARQPLTFRTKVRIATKVGNPHGAMTNKGPLNSHDIQFYIDQSLKKLGVEKIDIYYLHEPDLSTPLDETLEALNAGLCSGKIQEIGLSNVDLDYVSNVLATADHTVTNKIKYVQNAFNFLEQKDLKELIPFLKSRDIAYIAYSPLAGGLLTGKYDLHKAPPANSRLQLYPEPYKHFLAQETFHKIDYLKQRALQRQHSLTEEALQFILETPDIGGVIIGPKQKSHYENYGF